MMAVSKHSRRFLALSFVVAFGVVPADSAKLPGGGTIDPAFNEAIANIPGKSIVASVVTDEPRGMTRPHHHAKSSFVIEHALSSKIRGQVDRGPIKVFKAGEIWTERPGAPTP
jgi:quercetin dioxygenase-like cupin family protein